MTSTRSVNDAACLSDSGLMMAITRGSEAALSEAYSRHGRVVFAVAHRMCGGARAEDVSQEIFLALWCRPERFDPDRGSLRGFLSMQARGRAIDQLRSDGTRHTREQADGRLCLPIDLTEDSVAVDCADRLALDEALARLPALQREAIVMAFFGGNTYGEVARLLDQPVGTVKGRIRSGLRTLRELLGDPIQSEPQVVT